MAFFGRGVVSSGSGFSWRGASADASPAARGKCQGGCQKQNGCAEAEARDSGKCGRWIRVCREVAHAGFCLVHGRYSEPVQRAQAWRELLREMGVSVYAGILPWQYGDMLAGDSLRYTGNLGQYRKAIHQ